MVHFYHGAFVLGVVDNTGMLNYPCDKNKTSDTPIDLASDHVPDLKEFKSFLDIVTLCNINILMNALDDQTYLPAESDNPDLEAMVKHNANAIPFKECLSCIYTWGKSMDLLNWINDNYMLRDPATGQTETGMAIMVGYILQQIYAIWRYKVEVEEAGIHGSENALYFSRSNLGKQLLMVVKIFPNISEEMQNFSLPSQQVASSLAWKGVGYEVE